MLPSTPDILCHPPDHPWKRFTEKRCGHINMTEPSTHDLEMPPKAFSVHAARAAWERCHRFAATGNNAHHQAHQDRTTVPARSEGDRRPHGGQAPAASGALPSAGKT